jgi:hypothetical protein
MSNITLFDASLPGVLHDEIDEDTKALAGSGVGAMRRLSIKGGVFREMLGSKEYRTSEERYINVVVVRVAEHNARQYYPGAYVEGQAAAPVCWSSDGQKPDTDVREKQSSTCAACPQNVKGSGQGESRACRYQRRIAVVLESEIERREVYQLICPATSIFGDGERNKMPLQKYAQHLANHTTPITKIVTEVRFDTTSTQPKLTFKATRPLTDSEYAIVRELRDSPEAIKAVQLNAAQAEGAKATTTMAQLPLFADEEPESPPPAAKPVKAAAKKPVEAEVATDEPKKVPSKKPAPEPKLADLVGEWDD